MFLGWAI